MPRLRPTPLPASSLIALLALLLVAALAAGASPMAAAAPAAQGSPAATAGEADLAGVVSDVLDADTLLLRLADGRTETVRLLGIDAPERRTDGGAAGCFAEEAAAQARALAAGRPATVAVDVRPRDRAGRLLGYVWLDGDRASLNERLLEDGVAMPLSVGPNTAYSADYQAAARRARLAQRGIWAACPVSDAPTVATDYPLDETPALGASEPAVRLVVGTERDGTGRQLTIAVEARADAGLRGIAIATDRDDDPGFTAPREIRCDGQAVCRASWTARPRGLGSYRLTARALAEDAQSADAEIGLRVVGRWQTVAARAADLRARAAADPLPRAEDAAPPGPDGACPSEHPVKGLAADPAGGRRYLLPGDDGYDRASAAVCYADEDAAKAAGFTGPGR